MKSATFSFFRSPNQKLIDSASFDFEPYSFGYLSEMKIKEVKKSRKSDKYHIEIPSDDCDWSPDIHNIILNRRCTVKKPHALFGKRTGIAFQDEKLGLAAIISSITSSRRIVISYDGTIEDDDDPQILTLNVVLPEKTYRGNFTIETVLYVKEASSVDPPAYICNSVGTKLGIVEPKTEVFLDEKTPEFPTRIHGEGYNNPLWRLSVTWKDPLTDDFMKNVCLLINEDNPEFKNLKLNSDNKNKAMLSEIYSSAVLQIIYMVKNDSDPGVWDETMSGNPESIHEGSVSDYVYYMMTQRFNCDVLDIVSLSEKIRKTLYRGL